MSIEHIVVDGSNIATEGRSSPSLKQLEEAVTELRRDHPNAEITVIVDATFAHRIDPSELARFDEAVLKGEYVHPPAGAIGRGDAFLLRIAEKVDATVLSNDSFQEFHGEHPWLFERGRLLGGTPVPGIGWIFSPRQPVRGPRSRQAVRDTTQAKKRVTKAIEVATKEVVEPPVARRDGSAATAAAAPSRRRRSGGAGASAKQPATGDGAKPTPLAVNGPLTFISFIAEHRLGEELEGEVEGYTSHGAVVQVGDMRCYIPLANLAEPPPRSAREVLKRKETRTFVLTALDPQRRGAELALPGIARISGHPREETVAAEVKLAKAPPKRAGSKGTAEPALKKAAGKAAAPAKKGRAKEAPAVAEPAPVSARKKVAAKKAAATKAAATKAAATKAAVTKTAGAAVPTLKAPSAGTGTAKPAAAKKSGPAKAAQKSPPARAAQKSPTSKRAQPATREPAEPHSDGPAPSGRRSPRALKSSQGQRRG